MRAADNPRAPLRAYPVRAAFRAGATVRFTGENAPDYAFARDLLTIGEIYTVAAVEGWDGALWLRLRGVPGVRFNAAMFERVT